MAEFDWGSLLPILIGAYGGAKAGGNQQTTQTTQMSPQMQAQWDAYAGFANQVANRPYTNTVAPFSQDQYQGMDMVRNAAGGTPELQAGSQALQGFLGGGAQNPYMQSNPYLAGMMKTTGDQIQNRMNTSGFSSGSFGNSGIGYSGTKALADSANQLQYQDFTQQAGLAENALNRTASMIPQALQYNQVPFQNAYALMNTGGMQQGQAQQMMTNQWAYPHQQLDTMGKPLGLGQGTTSTTNQPGNQWASAIGGALLGNQFGNLFTPPLKATP